MNKNVDVCHGYSHKAIYSFVCKERRYSNLVSFSAFHPSLDSVLVTQLSGL